jgi:hypothetical protein
MAAMAMTGANTVIAARSRLRLPARVQALLSGEHASTQRMAGTAFIIRVAGAAVIYLSQVLLARWMGSFEFGTYVYAWTWLLLVGDIVHLGLPLTAQRVVHPGAEALGSPVGDSRPSRREQLGLNRRRQSLSCCHTIMLLDDHDRGRPESNSELVGG